MIHIEGFILGVLFVSLGIPLLDGIASLLLTMIEAAKGWFGVIVAKHNTAISDVMNPIEKKHTIGFKLEEEDEEDEEIL